MQAFALGHLEDCHAQPTQGLRLLGVHSDPYVAYDKFSSIAITISYDLRQATPSIVVFYIALLNQTTPSGPWRAAVAQQVQVFTGADIAIFSAALPNPIYNEKFPTNTKIVFYVQVTDAGGGTHFSCSEKDRWNPLVQNDKFSCILMDPYPPQIFSLMHEPSSPTSSDDVVVTLTASKKLFGSVIKTSQLQYRVDDGRWIIVPMDHLRSEKSVNDTKHYYEVTIPSQKEASKVQYHVTVSDAEGNRAISGTGNYTVSPSKAELARQQKELELKLALIAGIAIVGLVAIAIWITRLENRKRRSSAEGLTDRLLHPKATNVIITFLAMVGGWSVFGIFRASQFLAWIVAMALALYIMVVDVRFPRILSLLPRRVFNENPPLILLGASIALLLASLIGLAAKYIANSFVYALNMRENLPMILGLLRPVFFDILLIMCSGIVLQLFWPQLKEVQVIMEAEIAGDSGG